MSLLTHQDSHSPAAPLALRTADAAAALGICERSLGTLTAERKVPFCKLGRSNLYPVRELRNWLTEMVEATGVTGVWPAEGGCK